MKFNISHYLNLIQILILKANIGYILSAQLLIIANIKIKFRNKKFEIINSSKYLHIKCVYKKINIAILNNYTSFLY